MSHNILAIYLRLSKEDSWGKEESNSITNQRNLISFYIKTHKGLQQMEQLEFADDGCSGTNFERPQIKKLLDLVGQGKIQCIIVKDLSRFGRNFIDVGDYLEHIFPSLGVRFIAINDNFDSENYSDTIPGIEIALKNIVNSYLSIEQSFKVKNTIYRKRMTGEHVGAGTPYGYCKKSESGNRLHIDPEAAFIVRRIFDMTNAGMGRSNIARILNTEGVLTPGDYKKSQKTANPQEYFERKKEWIPVYISSLLRDVSYIGTAVSGKHYRPQMGVYYVKRAPREQWIIIEEAHEAIISREDYQTAQKTFKTSFQPIVPSNELFTGILSCGCCKRALKRRSSNGKLYYYCDSHRLNENFDCRVGKIEPSILEPVILNVIKAQIVLILDVKKFVTKGGLLDQKVYAGYKKQIKKLDDWEIQLKKKKKELYDPFKGQLVDKREYEEKRQKLKNDLEKNVNNWELQIDKKKKSDHKILSDDRLISSILNVQNCKTLSRELLTSLINRIYIYDTEHIKIIFKYKDEIKQLSMEDNQITFFSHLT